MERRARFFVAVVPPPEVRERARAVQAFIAERFGSRAALRSPPHVTLVPPFLHEDAAPLNEALSGFVAGRAPFSMSLPGFAAFAPRVIYIHVEPSPALAGLQGDLERVMHERFGLPLSTRGFTPHLSVGRRDLTRANFALAWEHFREASFAESFDVRSVVLLRHEGGEWHIQCEHPFG